MVQSTTRSFYRVAHTNYGTSDRLLKENGNGVVFLGPKSASIVEMRSLANGLEVRSEAPSGKIGMASNISQYSKLLSRRTEIMKCASRDVMEDTNEVTEKIGLSRGSNDECEKNEIQEGVEKKDEGSANVRTSCDNALFVNTSIVSSDGATHGACSPRLPRTAEQDSPQTGFQERKEMKLFGATSAVSNCTEVKDDIQPHSPATVPQSVAQARPSRHNCPRPVKISSSNDQDVPSCHRRNRMTIRNMRRIANAALAVMCFKPALNKNSDRRS